MLSIIVPTYNERENLLELIDRIESSLANYNYEIIIVDDDSPDRTWKLAEKISCEKENLQVIRRKGKRGLATAVCRGFEEAKGEILAVLDADLQHPPEKLKELYEQLKDNDLVVASRKTAGGSVESWPFHRKLISKGAEQLAKILVKENEKVKDPLSGFFALRRKVIEGINLKPKGYKILLEILAKGKYNSVKEIPYKFKARKGGSSSIGFQQYWDYLEHVIGLAKQTGELKRFIKFSIVGAIGTLVNLTVLFALTESGLFYLLSGALAIEASLLSNFWINMLWTYSDKADFKIARSLRRDHLVRAGGMGINLVLLWLLTSLGLWYLLSQLIGIAAATGWNFSGNQRFVWRV